MKKNLPYLFLLPIFICIGLELAVFPRPANRYIAAVLFVLGLNGLLFLLTRRDDPLLRRIRFLIVESLVVVFILILLTAQPAFAILLIVLPF
jgi:hypothetical protein